MSNLVWINDADGLQRAIVISVSQNGSRYHGDVQIEVARQPAGKVGDLETEGPALVLDARQAQSFAYSLGVAAEEAVKTDYRKIEDAKYALLGVHGDLDPVLAPLIGKLQMILSKIQDGEL